MICYSCCVCVGVFCFGLDAVLRLWLYWLDVVVLLDWLVVCGVVCCFCGYMWFGWGWVWLGYSLIGLVY